MERILEKVQWKYIWKSFLIVMASLICSIFFSIGVHRIKEIGGDFQGFCHDVFSVIIPLILSILAIYIVIIVIHPYFSMNSSRFEVELRKKALRNFDISLSTEEITENTVNDMRPIIEKHVDTKLNASLVVSFSMIGLATSIIGYGLCYFISDFVGIASVTACLAFALFSLMMTAWEIIHLVGKI